jgi:DNA-binding response OmpR family regulator
MRTVLIVEDTDLCSETLEVALTAIPNIEIRNVETAEDALACLSAGNVCAIVTDLHLPLMSGFELIETVRSHAHTRSLPLLVVSADTDPQTPARLTRLGVDAYFPKPYSPAEIRSKLEQLINAA